jgi:hypothetical protein
LSLYCHFIVLESRPSLPRRFTVVIQVNTWPTLDAAIRPIMLFQNNIIIVINKKTAKFVVFSKRKFEKSRACAEAAMSSDQDGTSPHEAPQEQQRLESAPARAFLKPLDRKRKINEDEQYSVEDALQSEFVPRAPLMPPRLCEKRSSVCGIGGASAPGPTRTSAHTHNGLLIRLAVSLFPRPHAPVHRCTGGRRSIAIHKTLPRPGVAPRPHTRAASQCITQVCGIEGASAPAPTRTRAHTQ